MDLLLERPVKKRRVYTPIFVTGFEPQVLANSSALMYSTVTGNATISTSIKRTGGAALKIVSANSIDRVGQNISGSPTVLVKRFGVYFDDLPAGSCIQSTIFVADTVNAQFGYSHLFQQFGVSWDDGGGLQAVGGPTVLADTWYMIDIELDVSTNPWTYRIYAQADGGVRQQVASVTKARAATTISSASLGTHHNNETFTAYFDDWVMSTTKADFPLDYSGVVALRPSDDGTHSPASPDCITDATVTAISGSNKAYQYIDDTAFPTGSGATDLIVQTGAHGMHYVEVVFPDVAFTRVIGVAGVLARNAGSTAGNTAACQFVEANGTKHAIFGKEGSLTNWGDSTLIKYERAIISPSGGWSKGKLDTGVVQFGFSGDASPAARMQALMLEAAVK